MTAQFRAPGQQPGLPVFPAGHFINDQHTTFASIPQGYAPSQDVPSFGHDQHHANPPPMRKSRKPESNTKKATPLSKDDAEKRIESSFKNVNSLSARTPSTNPYAPTAPPAPFASIAPLSLSGIPSPTSISQAWVEGSTCSESDLASDGPSVNIPNDRKPTPFEQDSQHEPAGPITITDERDATVGSKRSHSDSMEPFLNVKRLCVTARKSKKVRAKKDC